MTPAFVCSICGDQSTDLCVYCTKDACANHRCAKCMRCSDCCECVVTLEEQSSELSTQSDSLHEETPAGDPWTGAPTQDTQPEGASS